MIAVRMPGSTKNGKTPLRFLGAAKKFAGELQFNISRGWSSALGDPILLPCRQCINCRLSKSSAWACRLMHETKSHASSVFLTLTYDDFHLPKNGSLIKSDLRTFFKDLRGRLDYYGLGKIKFFGVGEYGEISKRPHYHAVIFGGSLDRSVNDYCRLEEEKSRSGGLQWSHDLISEVWSRGLHRLSEVTFESAAYVARYSLKKVTGASAVDFYGELQPEFQSSSNGLGKDWIERWQADVFPANQVVLTTGTRDVRKLPPPDYYLRLLEKRDPFLFEEVKRKRLLVLEKLGSDEFFQELIDRDREGQVKTLEAKASLIRGVL